MYTRIAFLFFIIANSFCFTTSYAKSDKNKDTCIVERAVFELGSGVTTAVLAKVNKCTGTLINLQKQVQKKMPYQSYINTTNDRKTLPKEAIEKDINTIEEAKKELSVNCEKVECRGVATAAIRNAKNADELINNLYKKTKVKITVISQNEEGLIGYYSAMIKANIPATKRSTTIVLDIGGGSYQVVYPYNKNHLVYGGMIGSSIFRTMVIELVKNYEIDEIHTPNPMTHHEIDETKLLATKAIGEPILGVEKIKELLNNPDIKIYGIGTFLKAIAKLCNTNNMEIKINDLTHLIDKLTLRSDDYIKEQYENFPYPNELITNLIFVYGIMHTLNINTLPVIDTNNTLGVLVLNKYW